MVKKVVLALELDRFFSSYVHWMSGFNPNRVGGEISPDAEVLGELSQLSFAIVALQ